MTNCFCAHLSGIFALCRNLGNKHKNNPLVNAETVRHLSTYIILYVMGFEQTLVNLLVGDGLDCHTAVTGGCDVHGDCVRVWVDQDDTKRL